MATREPEPRHVALMDDLKAALSKHQHLTGQEMLAVVSQLVGNLVAYQDSTRFTADQAMAMVSANIQIGNETALASAIDRCGRAELMATEISTGGIVGDRVSYSEPPRKGDWTQTYTGRAYWPLDPRAEDVDMLDIAHHLSQICRYCGACSQFWSVADHSVGVLFVARRHLERGHHHASTIRHTLNCALMHDAPEAYCHDLIRPIKRCIHGYNEIEAANYAAIAERFGLGIVGLFAAGVVKDADNAMLLAEQEKLMREPPRPWAEIDVPTQMVEDARLFLSIALADDTSPTYAKARFLGAARQLGFA